MMAGVTTVRFSDSLRAEADAYARKVGVTFTALVAISLRDYLDARKAPSTQTTLGVAKSAAPPPVVHDSPRLKAPVGRVVPPMDIYAPCPCGSGKKYKFCHGQKSG